MASADRGTQGSQDNKPIRESILTYEDIEASSSVATVDSRVIYEKTIQIPKSPQRYFPIHKKMARMKMVPNR